MSRGELIIKIANSADSWEYLAAMANKYKLSKDEFWEIMENISEERKDEFDIKWDNKYKYRIEK